jgi:hypothetical protein
MKSLTALFDSCRLGNQRAVLLAVFVIGVFLTGCQGMLGGKAQTIQKAVQIKVVKTGPQSGKFSDGYVTVNYDYTAANNDLEITGVVQFGSAITGNFVVVQTFDLGLLLADAQGKVLMQQGLATAVESNVSSPVNFNTTVFLPAQAVYMAFTYNGQAYGAGRESPTTFWADPVDR